MKEIKTIAFYLPQYHPIPENDEWWGKGFTEWTNMAKAKKLYRGHYQPHVPADLGFYDLRLAETRKEQANLAKKNGITGFCYYHYWFSGKRLLEKPFNSVLSSGEPDFPFCLCWANATWSGIWHGDPDHVLIEQNYPGKEDYNAHFKELLPAFKDERYIKVDDKPLFMVYRPKDIPEPEQFVEYWQKLAINNGLPGLFLVGVSHNDNWRPDLYGFNASVLQKIPPRVSKIPWRYPIRKLKQLLSGKDLTIYDYEEISDSFLRQEKADFIEFPCAIPNWDNTPRTGENGLILHGSSPEKFLRHFKKTVEKVKDYKKEHKIVFIKSWNEWAEGNHLEPDLRDGNGFLKVIKDVIDQD